MGEGFCGHCQLPLIMCPHGRKRLAGDRVTAPGQVDWELLDDLAERGITGDSPAFQSLYGGLCRGCGDRWEPGDWICWSADEDKYVHETCASGTGR